ncbi:alpha/beta hydrolase-fold protein [Paenibacillus sp. HB172176]|uniref:alpha/beta hydrolase n=1 Tax=Paenibacillus sp. HB172176 TaxID=2493690 RepID=UPI001439C85F|nr:alpha/beta hydrolase-fold protein [Paenibacillus sp. HB172176]
MYGEASKLSKEEAAREAFTMPNTEQFLLQAPGREKPYRIYVAKPLQAAPPEGFPVIYLLDANAVFATAVEAMRVQSRVTEKTGVHPAIIVGIGYPTNQPFDASRFYDFTMPTPKEVLDALPVRNKEQPRPEVGGADNLRAFIETVLKPRIARDYPIHSGKQTIFGHSLGGLFVLQTLFTKPESFQCYIAGSPSIHWNKALIHEQEEAFREKLPGLFPPDGAPESTEAPQSSEVEKPLKLYITTAEGEQGHPSGMTAHAIELFERLSAYPKEQLRVAYHEFEGEGHVSVLPALINRMLRFI